MTPEAPKTLLDAVRYYTDPKVTFQTMIAVKWPDGKITCPKCGCDKIGVIGSRSLLQCKDKTCRKQFSVKVDTIFEDSPLGLDKWFVAVWCIANAKNGISSLELGRALGVTQKTAWFMLHRIREAMKTKSFRKLQGTEAAAKNDHNDMQVNVLERMGSMSTPATPAVIEGRGQAVTREQIGYYWSTDSSGDNLSIGFFSDGDSFYRGCSYIKIEQPTFPPRPTFQPPPKPELVTDESVDAARYRWLRDNDGSESVAIENASGEVRYVFGEELDAAIDAAMEGE